MLGVWAVGVLDNAGQPPGDLLLDAFAAAGTVIATACVRNRPGNTEEN